MKGSVYFIEALGANAVKIGFTTQTVSQRLKALDTVSLFELDALAWIDVVAASRREDTLHARFHHLHIRREWFRLDAQLRSYIAGVRARGPEGALI